MADADFLQDIQDGLNEVLKPYQQRLNQRQRLADFVKQCIQSAGRNDFFKLDEMLKSRMAEDVAKETGLKGSQDYLDQLRTYADKAVNAYRIEFIDDLTARATEADLPIDIHFPKFSSLKGIDGEVDFPGRKTVLNKKTLKSVDPQRIITAIKKVKAQLYDRPFNPQNFIDDLCAAYLKILKEKGKSPGDTLPLHEIYFEYVMSQQSKAFRQDMDKGKFRGYSLDQFAVDLWRYYQAKTGGTSDGQALQLGAGRNNALSLIDADGERRQFTTIAFHAQESKGRKR